MLHAYVDLQPTNCIPSIICIYLNMQTHIIYIYVYTYKYIVHYLRYQIMLLC